MVVALGAIVVVGFYSYRTIYLDDPTFSADAGSLWRVTAEVFAGTIAAKAVTDLAGWPPAPAKRGGGEGGG
jgi:hypothetical protein